MPVEASKFHMVNYSETQLLVFADSEVASITFDEGSMRLLFSAAHVLRRDSGNNDKPLEGYSRGVELFSPEARFKASTEIFMGRLSFGRTMTNGKWLLQLPLPGIITSRITIELSFANQSHLEMECASLECRFTGEPNFFESMAC